MEKLNITKGEWKQYNFTSKYNPQHSKMEGRGVYSDRHEIAKTAGKNQDEADANAILVSDAGNTYQQCETLPSELLRQRKELLQALKEIVNQWDKDIMAASYMMEVRELIKKTEQ